LLERDWTRDDEDDEEAAQSTELPTASSSSSDIARAVVARGMPVPVLDHTSAAAAAQEI